MDEALLRAVTDRVCQMLQGRRRALLLGRAPDVDLGWEYVREPPYAAVVIGSMTLGQTLCFRQEAALEALAQGMPVYCYEKGLPGGGKSRALATRLSAARRELKAMGILFVDGANKPGFVSAEAARQLVAQGLQPPPGAVVSPLARDILDGKPVRP